MSAISSHSDWDKFLENVKSDWDKWRQNLGEHPCCLVILFGGLAFYEYEDNTFWPQFAIAVGKDRIDPNEQREISTSYSQTLDDIGLPTLYRKERQTIVRLPSEKPKGLLRLTEDLRAEYVGTAVWHVGIPLSLWSGFLDVCEWALWREDWKALSDNDWAESIGKLAAGRQRLKRFLLDNREAAQTFISEILDAKKILSEDLSISISDLSQASLLRSEYFEEVPETAEFLRPQVPESLFKDKARLVWNDQTNSINLYVPGLHPDKLPAQWNIASLTVPASSTPGDLSLNSIAFQNSLELKLRCGEHIETQRLQGIHPWGLFDLDRAGYLINVKREQLPLRCYALVSKEKVEDLKLDGFDITESPVNEPFELSDGTTCFVTRLWPEKKFAFLQIGPSKLRFRTRARIEARIFFGAGYRAAYFDRLESKFKVEHLPILCLSVPSGYFQESERTLNARFQIMLDERVASGRWVKENIVDDEDTELFFWKWSKKPFAELKPGRYKDFQELQSSLKSPDLRGERTLSILSPEFKIHYPIFLDHSKIGLEESWKNLPGAFLPWFLLCQSSEGMKWEDLMLAKDVIAPNQSISYYHLKKYLLQGLLNQHGRCWMIEESRAVLKPFENNHFNLMYCGDPSILWGLYRKIYHISKSQLPTIEVINKRGELPYLKMEWDTVLFYDVREYLRYRNVALRQKLWNL